MKTILILILAIVFSLNTSSQTLDGFLGIPFGSSKEVVKKAMLLMGSKLNLEGSDNDYLSFTGTNFAGRQTSSIGFRFVNNKFHTASVFIEPYSESQAVKLYKNIKAELTEKYYTPFSGR